MSINKLKIFFLGSGTLAVPVLKTLAASSILTFAGGATGISKPGKRGKKLIPTPVNQAADFTGVTLEEVGDVNTPEFVEKLKEIDPDMILVVSFGQILKSDILSLPRYGCVNIHPSVLPRYRGASPVVQAILNQDKYTEVCYMQMERGLDSGAVYRRIPCQLDGTEYCDALEKHLSEIAADNLEETLTGIADGKYQPIPQSGEITLCGKTGKNDGIINWYDDVQNIYAKIRAFHPWPGGCAWEISGNEPCRLTISKVLPRPDLSAAPGVMVTGTPKNQLCIGCGSGGALELLEVIPQGGKAMTGASFRNGRRGANLVFSPSGAPDGSE